MQKSFDISKVVLTPRGLLMAFVGLVVFAVLFAFASKGADWIVNKITPTTNKITSTIGSTTATDGSPAGWE